MNVADYAATALLRTLADEMPARLRAADQERRARIVCPRGPYVFAETSTIELQDETVEVPAGEHSAAELADLLAGIPDLVAGDDGEGRLVLTSPTAPTAERSSTIRVGRGTANDALGLEGRRSSVTVLAIGDPAFRIYPYSESVADIVDEPAAFLESAREVPDPQTRLHVVVVRLQVLMPGTLGDREATVEATAAIVDQMRRVVEQGDGRGRYRVGGPLYGEAIVRCFPRPWLLEPKTWIRGPGTRTWGRAIPEFEMKVWAP